jgi:hypothetical protein
MHRFMTSLVEGAGAVAVCVGAFTWNLGLGLVTSGVFALVAARQATR